VNVGGAIEAVGPADWTARLSAAFAVRAGENDATLTHPFHPYPARLHPEVARALVNWTGERVPVPVILDPFCGSGTVLVEATAAGAHAVGTDLSPVAVELARIKTLRTTVATRRTIVDRAQRIAREAGERARATRSDPPVLRGEERWYERHVLAELAWLRALIAHEAPGSVQSALRMLLSSIVVKVSRQRSDSDVRTIAKPVPAGSTVRLYARKALELTRGLAALAETMPDDTPAAEVRLDDATQLETMNDDAIDAIITSPPYANTYDYVSHHERRYRWLDMDAEALRSNELGAARSFAVPEAGRLRFEHDVFALVRTFARVLHVGGTAFVVTADGALADGRRIDMVELFVRASRDAGLPLVARVSQTRETFDRPSHRAFSRHPKREHLFAFRRS